MRVSRILASLVVSAIGLFGHIAAGAEFMFRANVEGKTLEGKPLTWTSQQMFLLGRDGKLYDFNPKLATEAEKTSPTYIPYTAAEIKALLQYEFDSRFDISLTRHYVVVHPRGERD